MRTRWVVGLLALASLGACRASDEHRSETQEGADRGIDPMRGAIAAAGSKKDLTIVKCTYDEVRDEYHLESTVFYEIETVSRSLLSSLQVNFVLLGDGHVVQSRPVWLRIQSLSNAGWQWAGHDDRVAINADGAVRKPEVSTNPRMLPRGLEIFYTESIAIPLTETEVSTLLAELPFKVAVGSLTLDLAPRWRGDPGPSVASLRAVLARVGQDLLPRPASPEQRGGESRPTSTPASLPDTVK